MKSFWVAVGSGLGLGAGSTGWYTSLILHGFDWIELLYLVPLVGGLYLGWIAYKAQSTLDLDCQI